MKGNSVGDKRCHIGRFSAGEYFPTQASVRGSIDQAGKWVSGQGRAGQGGEINFPGFPNLHSAAKKSICLIYREL